MVDNVSNYMMVYLLYYKAMNFLRCDFTAICRNLDSRAIEKKIRVKLHANRCKKDNESSFHASYLDVSAFFKVRCWSDVQMHPSGHETNPDHH